MMKPITVAVCTAALGLSILGCGDDSGDSTANGDGSTATAATATAATTTTADQGAKPAATGKTLKIVSSDFGKVIADTKGEALYLFTKEKGSKSRCYGDCAVAWPPLLTKGAPRAGKGVTAGKLGTTKRRDGRLQVTYNGHPLYYYKDDSPGKILCQDVAEFGGTWYVVKPSGRPVT